jgi:hypothetical protein
VALAPVGTGGGGGGGPAVGGVQAVGTAPALLVQSGTQAVEAITVYALDTVYGINFAVTISLTEFNGKGPLVTAEEYAGYIQQIASEDYVYGISYGQDVDASGNLVDMLFVTVGDPSGQFLGNVDVVLANANSTKTFDDLLKMVNALTTLAGGT